MERGAQGSVACVDLRAPYAVYLHVQTERRTTPSALRVRPTGPGTAAVPEPGTVSVVRELAGRGGPSAEEILVLRYCTASDPGDTLLVEADGHVPARIDLPPADPAAGVVDLGEIFLASERGLVGRVVDAEGRPLSGFRVSASTDFPLLIGPECSARTDSEGRFEMFPSEGAELSVFGTATYDGERLAFGPIDIGQSRGFVDATARPAPTLVLELQGMDEDASLDSVGVRYAFVRPGAHPRSSAVRSMRGRVKDGQLRLDSLYAGSWHIQVSADEGWRGETLQTLKGGVESAQIQLSQRGRNTR